MTDRRILDKQLQNTIKQTERVAGVVHPVDATSAQLRGYLESGEDIIISTIQKFSVIAEEIGKLKSKTFAVIDEILLGFVNSKLELYTKLSQPEINAAFKRHLYRDYLQQ